LGYSRFVPSGQGQRAPGQKTSAIGLQVCATRAGVPGSALLCFLLLFGLVAGASAHSLDTSYTRVTITAHEVTFALWWVNRRSWSPRFRGACSVLIFALGALWFLERTSGLKLISS